MLDIQDYKEIYHKVHKVHAFPSQSLDVFPALISDCGAYSYL